MTDGQPHNGGFVQLSTEVVWQWQLVCQLVEHLCFLAATTSCSIPRLLLPLLGIPETRKESLASVSTAGMGGVR